MNDVDQSDQLISVQLYTVREALSGAYEETLGKIADIGYRQVEPFGFGSDTAQLESALSAYGLTAPTTHSNFLRGGAEETFEAAARVGIGTVIDPYVDPSRWTDADEVRRIADELNAAVETATRHGVRLGYHNHHFELEQKFGDQHALEVFAEALDPAVVLEVDTYWAYVGGADVPALLRRLGDRVAAIHVKDGDGTLDTKAQVAVGSGSLPIWEIIDAAPASALRVVELDDSSGDLLQAVADSYAFLTRPRAA